ncbi:hypothetical protein MiAbW_01537 [Microcystis aeruginosa NIES-4325]|uniref:Uncharacterized protein n=2 Tax=Microcystis aeruginosa TaxID=1126 RepID=A0A5J4F7C8_MICAE|nr:hypothetical protein MiAbW_01537 [Microcystis aeruginosa NIES-4325]
MIAIIHQTMMERYIAFLIHTRYIPDPEQLNQQRFKCAAQMREPLYSYTKAIDNIDHDNADAYNKRSTARSANGDIKGAVEDLQKAQQLLKN